MLNTVPLFVVGTAQFGLNYGINNLIGKPTQEDVFEIVSLAIKKGYSFFDTAQAYGDSELVLGNAIKRLGVKPAIMSKLLPTINPVDHDLILDSIKQSCSRLNVDSLWALKLHRASWLNKWNLGLGDTLKQAKSEGLISHIGVSIYDYEEGEMALDCKDIEIIQCPFNAWDPTLLNHNFFQRAKDQNVMVFCRSIYLQGALLLSSKKIIQKLPQAEKISKKWDQLSKEWKISRLELSYRYVKSFNLPMIIGIESLDQLHSNLKLADLDPFSDNEIQYLQSQCHPFSNKNIVNPSLW